MKRLFCVTLCVVVCFIGMVAVGTAAAAGSGNCPPCPPPPPFAPNAVENSILTNTSTIISLINELSTNGVKCVQRTFYLTKDHVDGAHALTACAAGYHMASFWEIIDPTTLVYETTIGQTKADAGSGPPTMEYGWVRTGNRAAIYPEEQVAGQANCNAWTSTEPPPMPHPPEWLSGTVVRLVNNWYMPVGIKEQDPPDVGIFFERIPSWWQSNVFGCTVSSPVWCVSD